MKACLWNCFVVHCLLLQCCTFQDWHGSHATKYRRAKSSGSLAGKALFCTNCGYMVLVSSQLLRKRWTELLFSSPILKAKIDIDLVFSPFRKKWQFIRYFSLAKEPFYICVIDTCFGVIGTDEISNTLRVRETMHVQEWLEVFNVIRRFFNWDSSSTHFSNNKFRIKPFHSFQIYVMLVQTLEKQYSFFQVWLNIWVSQASPRQRIQQSDALLWLACIWLRALCGLNSPQTSQICKMALLWIMVSFRWMF